MQLASLLLALAPAATLGALRAQDEISEMAPALGVPDQALTWKAENGLAYNYRLPREGRDAEAWSLTLILHGSNLTRGWGFANHRWKDFRPHDLVVCPDGTTPNGNGGFNFLGEGDDVKRLKALIDELKALFPIDAVHLYGHSQGSFFSLHYAGLHPKDVNGIVAHASGMWLGTAYGKKGHHQAIVLMHGTQDPVVPYGQSAGAYPEFKKAKYPMARLRSLEAWNHWPAEHNGPVPHTSQQLAWCEGMTTADPVRMQRAFDTLATIKSKGTHDFAALYQVAGRLAEHELAPEELKLAAAGARDAVDALARAHKEALVLPAKPKLVAESWAYHLPLFLRAFDGVPACDEMRAEAKWLASARKKSGKHMRDYRNALASKNTGKGFEAGVKAWESGWPFHYCQATAFIEKLSDWHANAESFKAKKKTLLRYEELAEAFEAAKEMGLAEFERINETIEL